jgi:hypothetical protein
MTKKILLLLGIILSLHASNVDSDLDGVADYMDKCPNTPFTQLVDKNGCSKEQLNIIKKLPMKYNISIGYEQDNYSSGDSESFLTTVGVYKGVYSLLYSASILKTSSTDYKTSDSILSGYYKKYFSTKFKLKTGIKIYFPTYYNKKIDYALKIQGTYKTKNYDISLSEKHKIYTESGTKDKDTIMLQIGKKMKRFYIAPYIYTENSIYDVNDWTNYYGLFIQYSWTKKFYSYIDYSQDESSNNTIVFSSGYFF